MEPLAVLSTLDLNNKYTREFLIIPQTKKARVNLGKVLFVKLAEI